MGRNRTDSCLTSYYMILGLKEDASEKDIKERYRELAKIYHPDVNHSPDAEEKFKKINEAYNCIISHIQKNRCVKIKTETKYNTKYDNNKILKDILRSLRKEIRKNLERNIKKITQEIYKSTVRNIKKGI